MPRHYFDVRSNDGTAVADERGETLPNVAAARVEARRCAYKLAVAEYRRISTVDGRKVEIVGETGKLVDDVRVRDSVIELLTLLATGGQGNEGATRPA